LASKFDSSPHASVSVATNSLPMAIGGVAGLTAYVTAGKSASSEIDLAMAILRLILMAIRVVGWSAASSF
jgi:hypothetical protein